MKKQTENLHDFPREHDHGGFPPHTHGHPEEPSHPHDPSKDRPEALASELYRFYIMKKMYETSGQHITGRQILQLAGLEPPEEYKLDMRFKGGEYREIALDSSVNLAEKGFERFVYIKRDKRDG